MLFLREIERRQYYCETCVTAASSKTRACALCINKSLESTIALRDELRKLCRESAKLIQFEERKSMNIDPMSNIDQKSTIEDAYNNRLNSVANETTHSRVNYYDRPYTEVFNLQRNLRQDDA